MGLRLRAEAHCRRLRARFLFPSLDQEDKRCGYYEGPALGALSADAAASPLSAEAAAGAAGADRQLRVLKRQHRVPLWWPGRFRPVWLQQPRVGEHGAVLLRGRTDALPVSRGVFMDQWCRVGRLHQDSLPVFAACAACAAYGAFRCPRDPWSVSN